MLLFVSASQNFGLSYIAARNVAWYSWAAKCCILYIENSIQILTAVQCLTIFIMMLHRCVICLYSELTWGGMMIITHNYLNAYLCENSICNVECVRVTIPPSNYTSKRTVHVACVYVSPLGSWLQRGCQFIYLLRDQFPGDIILVLDIVICNEECQ